MQHLADELPLVIGDAGPSQPFQIPRLRVQQQGAREGELERARARENKGLLPCARLTKSSTQMCSHRSLSGMALNSSASIELEHHRDRKPPAQGKRTRGPRNNGQRTDCMLPNMPRKTSSSFFGFPWKSCNPIQQTRHQRRCHRAHSLVARPPATRRRRPCKPAYSTISSGIPRSERQLAARHRDKPTIAVGVLNLVKREGVGEDQMRVERCRGSKGEKRGTNLPSRGLGPLAPHSRVVERVESFCPCSRPGARQQLLSSRVA